MNFFLCLLINVVSGALCGWLVFGGDFNKGYATGYNACRGEMDEPEELK